LSGICVLFDSQTNKLARVGTDYGCTPGLTGPFPNTWPSGIYTKVNAAPRESPPGPANQYPSSQGTFMTRELNDPYVKFNEMTAGSLNFNLVTNQPYFILGIIFLCMSIIPLVFLLILGTYGFTVIVKLICTPRASGNNNEARKGLLNEVEEPEGRTQQYPLEYGEN